MFSLKNDVVVRRRRFVFKREDAGDFVIDLFQAHVILGEDALSGGGFCPWWNPPRPQSQGSRQVDVILKNPPLIGDW